MDGRHSLLPIPFLIDLTKHHLVKQGIFNKRKSLYRIHRWNAGDASSLPPRWRHQQWGLAIFKISPADTAGRRRGPLLFQGHGRSPEDKSKRDVRIKDTMWYVCCLNSADISLGGPFCMVPCFCKSSWHQHQQSGGRLSDRSWLSRGCVTINVEGAMRPPVATQPVGLLFVGLIGPHLSSGS